jgi:ABC-2 type transport system ATP-binding protein
METFVLDLKQSQAQLPALTGIQARLIDPNTLEVDVAKSNSLNSVFAALTAQGIDVLSMRNKTNRLEELFVELVERDKGASA